MSCVLPLVQKAWEWEEFFKGHELGFMPHIIKGRCSDGTCLLPDTFFPSHDTSVWVPVRGLPGKGTHTAAVLEILQSEGRTCVAEVNEGL